MSISVMTRVWADAPVDGNKLLILLALADWCNDDCECWPAYQTLADKARIDKSTAIRNIKKLEELGLIRVERHAGRSQQNRYILCLDAMGGIKGCDLPPPKEKVANRPEKVANDPLKGGTDATQTVKEPLEPSLSVAAPQNPDDLFEDFLSAHPRPKNQDRTRELWDGVVAGGVSPDDLIRAARTFAHQQKGNAYQYIAGSDAWLDRKGHLDALRGDAPKSSPKEVNQGIADRIKQGKPFLVTNVTDTKAAELVALGFVTADQCQAVGLRP